MPFSLLTRRKVLILIFLVVALGLITLVYLFRNPLISFVEDRLTTTVQRVVTEDEAVVGVVDKASPAVVSIVEKTVITSPFTGPLSQEQGIGTGFIIRENGLILTNKHVVSDQNVQYSVVTKDGKEYTVKKVTLDPAYDLAILKIDASNLPVLTLGDSDKIKVGQTAIAIGNALGRFSNTVTKGVVSGVARGITASTGYGTQSEELDNVIQTDAAINPGNSGGPLLNLSSEVVGINVATASGAQNIGFALPINVVKPVVEQFEKEGRIIRPYLGVSYYLITEDDSKLRGIPQGAFVQQVVSGSGAQKAGLVAGDIITAINGEQISENDSLASVIIKYGVGDKITLTVVRGSKTLTFSATLGEAPAN